MRLNMLGGLGLEPADFHRPKPLLLLAYLAVEGSKEKRHLYELFWPGAADQATSLRMALSQLRKVAPDLTTSDERTISTNVENDLAALQSAITEQDAEALERLYQGEFLQGFSLPDWGAELEEWVYSTREFVAARVRSAYIRVAEGEAGKGEFKEAVRWAERAYGLGKDHLEPEELERLYPLLVAGDSAVRSEVKKQAMEYGLELNFSPQEARERYFKETTADTPQPQSIAHNLPRSKTSFIGRDPELVELGQRIGEPNVQLITLLGPGGIGKTRLALQLAHGQLQEEAFEGGIYFAALEALSEPSQIPLALAQTLKVKVTDDPMGAVKAGIGEKKILLILDNFEHLVDGALLVSELLEACPNLRAIVTSRERLNLEEEHVLPLQGLPFPKEVLFAEAEYVDAIKLFVQRAKRTHLNFELTPENLPSVLEVCRLVEGSPLGIELAAVWLRSLSVAEIAREIKQNLGVLETSSRNIPGRHQSIRAAFEHSWKLLKPKEQLTLARLSVFRGGFTREAASAVVDSNLALLSALVDKSLLRVAEADGRYDFHPLLHQYANEKLSAVEHSSYRLKHANYINELARQFREATSTHLEDAWIGRIRPEFDNVRGALSYALEMQSTELGLDIMVDLWAFWYKAGLVTEAKQLLTSLQDLPQEQTAAKRQAQGYNLNADLHRISGDHSIARKLFQQSLQLFEAQGDEHGVVHVRNGLGIAAYLDGDPEAARESWEKGLALAERNNIPIYIANLSNSLGFLAKDDGDYQRMTRLFERALEIYQEIKHKFGSMTATSNLGFAALHQGELELSLRYQREALRGALELAHDDSVIRCLEDLASLAAAGGQAALALQLAATTSAKRQALNLPIEPQDKALLESYLGAARAALDEMAIQRAVTRGGAMTLNEAAQEALRLELGPGQKRRVG